MVICNSRFILDLRGLYPGGFKEDTLCSAHTEESTTPFVRFASIVVGHLGSHLDASTDDHELEGSAADREGPTWDHGISDGARA